MPQTVLSTLKIYSILSLHQQSNEIKEEEEKEGEKKEKEKKRRRRKAMVVCASYLLKTLLRNEITTV